MIRLRNIFLFPIIINISFVFSYDCRNRDEVSCDLMKENIKEFLIKVRGLKEPKNNYSENKEEIECHIIELVKSECEPDQQDSVRARIQYYFGIHSSYAVGDLAYYKNIFNNSLVNLEQERKYLRNTDEDEKDRLIKKRNANNNLTRVINDSLYALDRKYADIDLYLDSENELSEMAKVIHKNSTDKSVVIKINAPPNLYSDRKYLDRINYLQKFPIEFNLTSYDEEHGFYCKIPLVPVIKIIDPRSIKPRDTYALSFSGDKRYRFEFYRDSEEKLSNVPRIKMNTTTWDVVETLPTDWTKLEIPIEISWIYRSKSDKKVIAQWNYYSNKIESEKYNVNDLLIIRLDTDYIIYQKLHEKKQKMDYELIIDKKESGKWLRRSLAPLFTAIITVIAYQTL